MFIENHKEKKQRGEGWIEVICGSMFSGKTEELLRRLNRAKIAGQKVEIFKPLKDTRYHKVDIVSHDQKAMSSTPVESSEKMLLLTSGADVVAIDEAQFFDDNLPNVCNELANQGFRVIVAGLDMDFQGKPFGPMPYLMAIAEYVTKVHAICVKTGKLASYSHRFTEGKDQIELGASENYVALSRQAYLEANFLKSKKPKENESN